MELNPQVIIGAAYSFHQRFPGEFTLQVSYTTISSLQPRTSLCSFLSMMTFLTLLKEQNQQKKTSTSLYLNPPISLNSCLPSHHCGCTSNRHLSILPSKADIYLDVWSSSLPIHLRTLGLPMSLLTFHVPTLLDHFY